MIGKDDKHITEGDIGLQHKPKACFKNSIEKPLTAFKSNQDNWETYNWQIKMEEIGAIMQGQKDHKNELQIEDDNTIFVYHI